MLENGPSALWLDELTLFTDEEAEKRLQASLHGLEGRVICQWCYHELKVFEEGCMN
jgi:hypothetical protein